MVDFNNETTVSTPATNLVKLLVLEARYNALQAIEFYNDRISKGSSKEQSLLRARLGTWYLELQAYIDRTIGKEKEGQKKYAVIRKELFFSNIDLTYDDIMNIIIELNNIMDGLKITKLDTRVQFNTTNIERDNEVNEYG